MAPPARVTSMVALRTVAGVLGNSIRSMPPGLKTDTVHRGVHFGFSHDLFDLLGQCGIFSQVDGFTAEGASLLQPLWNHVAHDHACRSQKLAGGRTGQPHRTRARHVGDAARADSGRNGSVIAGRKDVRKQCQVPNLFHGLVPVGKFQEVEISVGDHHVFCLATDPAPHVDIAVGGAGPGRVDFHADACLALFTVAATPAGDIEGNRDDISDLQEFHVSPTLNDFAGDLVAKNEARPEP